MGVGEAAVSSASSRFPADEHRTSLLAILFQCWTENPEIPEKIHEKPLGTLFTTNSYFATHALLSMPAILVLKKIIEYHII